MALLYKQLSPLYGVWKMEESSDELLGMLEHKADYSSFLERVSAEKRRQERFRQPDAFKRAFRRGGKG